MIEYIFYTLLLLVALGTLTWTVFGSKKCTCVWVGNVLTYDVNCEVHVPLHEPSDKELG